MPSLRHTHTYQRIANTEQYRCIHPDCSHFAHKKFLLFKRALCRCGESFILDKNQLNLKTPHCIHCTKKVGDKVSKKIKMIDRIQEMLNDGSLFVPPSDINQEEESAESKDKGSYEI